MVTCMIQKQFLHVLFRSHILFLVPMFVLGAESRAQDEEGGTTYKSDHSLILMEAKTRLEAAGIGTGPQNLTTYLERYENSTDEQASIRSLIQQLAAGSFAQRSEAYLELLDLGDRARFPLEASSTSNDPEIRWRSRKLLEELNSSTQVEKQLELTIAALRVLKASKFKDAAPLLLDILPTLPVASRDLAYEAIWACTAPQHMTQLAAHIESGVQEQKVAAILAWELIATEEQAAELLPYLSHTESRLRLAAARALLDRYPDQAMATLLELIAVMDESVRWHADTLLRQKADEPFDLGNSKSLEEYWQLWAENHSPESRTWKTLGTRRLDLFAGRLRRVENFTRTAESVASGYGPFQFTADNQGDASVRDGVLRIHGNQQEGDQRFWTTSQKLMGRPRWPDKLELTVRIGGEEGNNFGWHPAVSVGNIKILFHPGVEGGAFRAETAKEHDYLFNNTSMGFVVKTGTMYEMKILVEKFAGGAAFSVKVKDPATGNHFQKDFEVTEDQLVAYDRIALERSGRTGADAIFDAITIQAAY